MKEKSGNEMHGERMKMKKRNKRRDSDSDNDEYVPKYR